MDSQRLQIPSSYSRIIARMLGLQERGLPGLLVGTGLPVSILQPGDETLISGDQQVQVLANGHRLMRGPGFGLAMGAQLGPASHGPVGYLSLASPDLHSALKAYADFIPARLPLIDLRVTLSRHWLECSYDVLVDAPDYIRHGMAESFAVSVQAIVEEILRRDAVEAEIAFSHPEPEYADRYAEVLHGTWSFEQEQIFYRLPASLSTVANTTGDSEAVRLAGELCNGLLQQARESASSSDRVRTLLLTVPQSTISEEQVARSMFVSKRTLARRLAREGTGYRQLRDEVLCELAGRFLRQTNRSVESIAVSLGYNDSAAFRKAFRRWTGTSPAAFRAARVDPVECRRTGAAR